MHLDIKEWEEMGAPYCKVTLDGNEVSCVEADEEEGYVMAYKRDAGGDFIIADEELVIERLEGVVLITIHKKER